MPTEEASKPAEPAKPPEKPRPSYHIYSRQRDQHVVGEGCWCMPRVEIVNGERIVIHKRD